MGKAKVQDASLHQAIDQIDASIRKGDQAAARNAITALCEKKIPRPLLCRTASLARRSDVPLLAISILAPIVRPSRPLQNPASDDERAEYAANLIRVGAQNEALTLLNGIRKDSCPSALLYEGYAHVAVWDYAAAKPCFEEYIAHSGADSYLKSVANVNLASCLVYEKKTHEAELLIQKLLSEATEKNAQLLLANLYELRAQNLVVQGEWAQVKDLLSLAKSQISGADSLFSLFIEKWKVVAELKEKGPSPERLALLAQVRAHAEAKNHWETVRHCDRLQALLTHDAALALRVYFGTPFNSFRNQLKADWGEVLQIPAQYPWRAAEAGPVRVELDLGQPEAYSIKAGSVLHRLFLALSTDFYRPFRLASLHAYVYPGEFFNPESSILRVHQIMNRLRKWIEHEKLPISVHESQGYYQLKLGAGVSVFVGNKAAESANPAQTQINKMKAKIPAGSGFQARDVEECFDMSPSSALRLINRWVESGVLVRKGLGKKITYTWAVDSKHAA